MKKRIKHINKIKTYKILPICIPDKFLDKFQKLWKEKYYKRGNFTKEECRYVVYSILLEIVELLKEKQVVYIENFLQITPRVSDYRLNAPDKVYETRIAENVTRLVGAYHPKIRKKLMNIVNIGNPKYWEWLSLKKQIRKETLMYLAEQKNAREREKSRYWDDI